MSRAGAIVGEVLQALREQVKPGIQTAQLDKCAEDLIVERGALPSFKGYKGYPFATCLSVNEQVVHGFPSERQLLPGDIIGVDVGVFLDGYHADAATTIPVGHVDSGVARLMEVTRNALNQVIDLICPGIWLGDISATVQEEAEKNGFQVIRDLFGHGIGKALHEDPMIPNFGRRKTGPRLKAGMVLAIEPMLVMGNYPVCVLDDGWTVVTQDRQWSAHEEHTIAVTRQGAQVLTGRPG